MAKHYSEAEEQIIIECVTASPGNLTVAYENAARKLRGRTPLGIGAHYSKNMRGRVGHQPIMALATRNQLVVDKKIVKRPDTRNQNVTLRDIIRESLSDLSLRERMEIIKDLMGKS